MQCGGHVKICERNPFIFEVCLYNLYICSKYIFCIKDLYNVYTHVHIYILKQITVKTR